MVSPALTEEEGTNTMGISSISNRSAIASFDLKNNMLVARAASNKKTSAKYAPIDTAIVLERVLAIGLARGFQVTGDARVRHTGSKSSTHTVRLRFNALSGTGNNQGFPELIIRNSYNGESALSFHLGFYRLICSNGLTIAVPGTEGINIAKKARHVTGPVREFTRTLDDAIVAAFAGLQGLQKQFTQLENTPVTAEQEDAIVERLGLSKAQRSAFNGLRAGNAGRDTEANLWAVYNCINEAYRKTSRSEFANENRNVELLAKITEIMAA